MGLISAEGQKQECLIEQQIIFLLVHENLVNPLFSKVIVVFYLIAALSMCILQYPCCGESVWPEEIFIQTCTLYNWPRLKSCPIFYSQQHCQVWLYTVSLNILEHFQQNVFFPKHSRNILCPNKISARVSFSFKVRERNITFEFPQFVKLTFLQLLKFNHSFNNAFIKHLTIIFGWGCLI